MRYRYSIEISSDSVNNFKKHIKLSKPYPFIGKATHKQLKQKIKKS